MAIPDDLPPAPKLGGGRCEGENSGQTARETGLEGLGAEELLRKTCFFGKVKNWEYGGNKLFCQKDSEFPE